MNNPLSEAHPPFTAVGRNVVNSNGVPVATATNPSTAEALVALANAGVPALVAVVGNPETDGDSPRFPEVTVGIPTPGTDLLGNILVSRVWGMMTRCGVSLEDRQAFAQAAALSNGNDLVAVCRRWVTVR